MTANARIALTLAVFFTMLALVVIRPRRRHEAWWTVAGAALMLLLGLVSPREAIDTTLSAKNPLLFLLSLLALSTLLGKSGFFDWAAIRCARLSGGCARGLYRNVFVLGALVTATMSLDTTAVMLTPIVIVIARRLALPAAPFVVSCVFVANVGSLLLPISNLTNLLFADSFQLTFAEFAARMLVPQAVALATTYWLLRWHFRGELPRRFARERLPDPFSLIPNVIYFRACVGALAIVFVGYFAAPVVHVEPYIVTFLAVGALAIIGITTGSVRPRIVREVSWGVFPFVIGLFIAVRALENLGATSIVSSWLAHLPGDSVTQLVATSSTTAVASNLMNNLPAALLARNALLVTHVDVNVSFAALIGANAGPMVLPFGSLATILVLAQARREGVGLADRRLLLLGLWMTPIIVLVTTMALVLQR
jgi:arsenical pump membrane protein